MGRLKNCLTIAGSDCSGGAGIQADLKTFSANGTYGMSVIVAIVAENTSRVISIQDMNSQMIKDQIDAIYEDIAVDAVKVGMLSGVETMKTVAGKLREYKPEILVVDPVMTAKGGCALMQPGALETLKREILSLTYLVTPNIPEAQTLTGIKIKTVDDMKSAAKVIKNMGAKNVLIKGGHLDGEAIDILFDGDKFNVFSSDRIKTKNTHGTGCTLSSAITANLAKGINVERAVKEAKDYVTMAIKYSLEIGKGCGPTNHFYELYQMKGFY